MLGYLFKRLLSAVAVVAVVVTCVFFLMFGIGDPAATQLGPNARPEQIQDFKEQHGLDRSIAVQYMSYLGLAPCVRRSSPNYDDGQGHCGLLQGDLAESFTHRDPVADVIARRLPRTLLLSGMALFFQLTFGLVLGVIAATRHNTWLDTTFMGTAFLGISLPTYVTGPLFLLFICSGLGWFPVGGYGEGFWGHVYHGIMPAFTLAIVGSATYARIMRSEMLETLNQDYVRTAKAKGLSGPVVVIKHAMRNALLPIVTLMGLSMAILVSGAIITENIFAWPGMGSLAIEAINTQNVFTVTGIVLIFSLTVQAGNLLADIAVAALDPRIRLGDEGSK